MAIFSACARFNLIACLHSHPVSVVTDGGYFSSHLDYRRYQNGQKVSGLLFGRRNVMCYGYRNDAAGLHGLCYDWYRCCDGVAGRASKWRRHPEPNPTWVVRSMFPRLGARSTGGATTYTMKVRPLQLSDTLRFT